MLGIMRKYKQSFIIKAVFIVIVLSFVGTIFLIWGKGDEGLSDSGYAVKVNRESISYKEFAQNYERMKNSIQQMYGQPMTPEVEKQIGLRKMVIDNLVTTTLVKQEAKKMGIKVSDEEVIADISKMPYFQKNGAFDKQLYEQVLKANRLTPGAFEDAKRKELMLEKARKSIMDAVKVSDQDARQAYARKHDRLNLQFVSFAPAEVQKEVKATDQEMNDFLKRNEKEFRTREEISLSYVLVTPEKTASKVAVSAEEIQTFYQKNIDRYQGKEGILPFEEVKVRVTGDALRFKAAKHAYELAADALNKNLAGGNLTAAAGMLGATVTETPMFTMQNPPASLAGESAILQKAFLLKQGEIGGPLETSKGVYLFKIKNRKPSVVPPLDSIRSEVEKRVIAEKAAELARKKATESQSQLAKGTFAGTMRETGSFQFSEKGEIPVIGNSRELMEGVFNLTKNAPALPEPFMLNGRWYAIRLKERIAAPDAAFQKERQQLIQSLLPSKQREALEKWLKGLRDKAKIVINPALTTD